MRRGKLPCRLSCCKHLYVVSVGKAFEDYSVALTFFNGQPAYAVVVVGEASVESIIAFAYNIFGYGTLGCFFAYRSGEFVLCGEIGPEHLTLRRAERGYVR